jgi:hypothetical protein
MASKRLMLSPPERRELGRRLRSRSVRSEDARRADVILRSARGQSVREIAGAWGVALRMFSVGPIASGKHA